MSRTRVRDIIAPKKKEVVKKEEPVIEKASPPKAKTLSLHETRSRGKSSRVRREW